MVTPEELPPKLRQWWNYEFSSGPYTGPDYRAFQDAYARWLRKALPKYKVDVHRNHYEFSAVIAEPGRDGNPDRYVYLSISDVRFFPNRWATGVLVRTMAHKKDWTGGTNNYCTLPDIPGKVAELMERTAA